MLSIDFSTFPVLETERLLLRRLEPTDEREIFILRNDARVNQFIDRPGTSTVADATAFIHKIIHAIAENKSIYWAITEKHSDKLIGTICIWNIDTVNDVAETGYELMPAMQGKGIMNEAFAKVIAYGFVEMELKRIEAYVHPDNKNSIVLLERFNFKRITTNPGSEGDEILYSLDEKSIMPLSH